MRLCMETKTIRSGTCCSATSSLQRPIARGAAISDITYIATDEAWLSLAVVIDLFSRQVVGWSLRHDMTLDIVIDALRMAWCKRHPSEDAGLIFHSDSKNVRASCSWAV
jgi:transposase InsO family protein